MDLRPYTARGFPADIDKIIAEVPVAGIDREQVQSIVRMCAETEGILYGENFSPRAVKYRRGSRAKLEEIVAKFSGSAEERAGAAMNWVREHVVHPHFAGATPADRGLDEEGLIESGRGYCNEQSRVLVTLCEMMEIPGRLVFLFHASRPCGHVAAELRLRASWAFHDTTFGVRVKTTDGRLAEARELRGAMRHLAHDAYRAPMRVYYARGTSENQPDPEFGGDLLAHFGIVNYVADGVEVCG
jgi:hypothetical protein